MTNSHTPIISREDWEGAQVIRDKRKTKTYQFTGLIKCQYCGATLIRVVHEKRWVSWICAKYVQKGKSTCIGMRISDAKLKALIGNTDLKEPMVLKEDESKNAKEKSFYIVPAKGYFSSINKR